MSDLNYSASLRELALQYYNQMISEADYRTQRKIILDKIDEEYNGRKANNEPTVMELKHRQQDENDTFMQTIAFVRNRDLEPNE